MPRKRKPPGADGRADNGGVRQGTPGRSYGNRSDLRMPSQEYGQGVRLERAQQAVPMAGAPAVSQPAAGAGPSPPARPRPGPGEVGGFTRPTDRPSEPLTTGIPGGPGAGPEALGPRPADRELEAMRPYLPTLELLAGMPNASPTARMFVRRLRGMMPPPQG